MGILLRVFRKFGRPNLENRPSIRNVKLTVYKDHTWRSLSGEEYATRVTSYFSGLNARLAPDDATSPTGKQEIVERFKSKADDFVISEFSSLRNEIISIKHREIESEKFLGPTFAAIYVAYYTGNAPYLLLIVPLIFAFFGLARLREYQRNIMEIDSYLREREYEFLSEGGYVNYFFSNRVMEKYFETREWFWYTCFAIGIAALAMPWVPAEYLNLVGLDRTPIAETTLFALPANP
jgi:hypothetical protein